MTDFDEHTVYVFETLDLACMASMAANSCFGNERLVNNKPATSTKPCLEETSQHGV